MAENTDEFIKKLQDSIMEEIKNKYSETVIDHWQNPRNMGRIPFPDGYARYTGPCGDTMEFYIKVVDNKIVQATFETDGCGTTIACGSITTTLAIGKDIPSARKITQQTILSALGGLPESDQHCALLSATTLQKAILDYLELKREPWRKFYRRV